MSNSEGNLSKTYFFNAMPFGVTVPVLGRALPGDRPTRLNLFLFFNVPTISHSLKHSGDWIRR